MALSNSEKRLLKARAQKLEPVVKVGKQGLSEAFYKALDQELENHELVKLKFVDLKEQKKELAPRIAEQSGSELIMMVGNVAVFFRARPKKD